MDQEAGLRGIRHLVNPRNVADVDLSEIERRITGAGRDDKESAVDADAAGAREAHEQLQMIAAELGLNLEGNFVEDAEGAPAKGGLSAFVEASGSEEEESEEGSEEGSDSDGDDSEEDSEGDSDGDESEASAPFAPPSGGGATELPSWLRARPAPTGATLYPQQQPQQAQQRKFGEPHQDILPQQSQQGAPASVLNYAKPFAPAYEVETQWAQQGQQAAPSWNGPAPYSGMTPHDIRAGQITEAAGYGGTAYEDTLAREMQMAEEHSRMVDEFHELYSQAKRMRLPGLERLPQINYDTPIQIVSSARKTLRTQMQGTRFTGVAEDLLLELAAAAGDICDGSWSLVGNFNPDLRPLRNTLASRLPRMRPSTSTAVKQTVGDLDLGAWGEIGIETVTAVATTLTSTHRSRTRPITYSSQRRGDNISRIAESAPQQ